MLDAAQQRCWNWNILGFSSAGRELSLAIVVDNLLSTGSSLEAAVAILQDCKKHVSQHWGLHFGEDSKEFLAGRGRSHPITVDSSWGSKATMESLGHFLDDDAGVRSCFEHSKAAIWRCLYGNMSAGLAAPTTKAKMRFCKARSPIPSFRWARCPYQDTYKTCWDSIKRHMI